MRGRRSYADVDGDIIAVLVAIGDVSSGTNLQFAVNGGVLVDQEHH